MYEKYLNTATVANEEFLTQEECIDITNKVLLLKDSWQTVPEIRLMNFLPIGMYVLPIGRYLSNVIKYRNLMNDMFCNYYEKIKSELSNLLGLDIIYHEKVNYPGFHISTGGEINFHRDRFHYLNSLLKIKPYFKPRIVSVIIPISMPANSTGLLLRYNQYNNRFAEQYDDYVEYKSGMLAIWDGEIEHSIKPFKAINDSDIRITIQMHVAIKDSTGYLFW